MIKDRSIMNYMAEIAISIPINSCKNRAAIELCYCINVIFVE